MSKINQGKVWYQSKGVVGGVVGLVCTVLLSAGIEIPAAEQTHIVNLFIELGALVGIVTGIYGRVVATKQVVS